MWISWILLAAFAVISQSSPLPDEYAIPAIPLNRRAQYYVLHDDGDFKYGHDTGEGAYESAVKMSDQLTGFFGFNNPLGQKVRIDYTAGADGFKPSGNVLPVAPSLPAGFGSAQPVILKSAIPSVPASQIENEYTRSENEVDGSYDFSYNNVDSSRKESADSSNNVVGEYSFIADGRNHQIRYKAGASTGYVAEGDSIPVAPEQPEVPVPSPYAAVPQVVVPVLTPTLYTPPGVSFQSSQSVEESFQPRGDASYSFKYETDSSDREETADSDLNVKGRFSFIADDGVQRRVNYIAGSSTGFVAEGDHLPVAPEVPANVELSAAPIPTTYTATGVSGFATSAAQSQVSNQDRDASYQFSYDTGDSSRSETSDSDLNVRGDFSFVAPDGQRRTVEYVAGSSTGFLAEGDHLPIAPESQGATVPAAATLYTVPVQDVFTSQGGSQRNDASYSFNYENSDSSRFESADSDLNVKGQYAFVGDDGIERRVNYKAGSGIGFVAEGESIPSAQTVGVQPVLSAAQAPAPAQLYSAPIQTHNIGQGQETSSITNQAQVGGGYSFSYTNSDSSRSETADSANNVIGHYSFRADDGINRRIDYKAGSSTGFVAEGESIPSAQTVDVQPLPSAPHAPAPTQLYSAPIPSHVTGQGHESSSVTNQAQVGGGYSFSYTNSDSSRSETADSANNVVGHYSFRADDGINRRIDYKAGSSTGYVAEGDSIPVAVSVPAQTYLQPTGVQPTTYQAGHVAFTGNTGSSVSEHNFESGSDGSYSFGYKTDDSDREESADSDLNVKGRFSFVADDGIRRNVNYIAGSDTGFVADGDHLPVAPETPAVQQVPQSTVPLRYVAPVAAASVPENTERGDASYHFSYQNENSAREESADSDLNVKGRFGFIGDDGQRRTVNYIAGSSTGFVAEGDHLPVAPEFDAHKVTGATSAGSPVPKPYSVSQIAPVSPNLFTASADRRDASYSFRYDNDDSSRDETADENLNVRGHFRFIADDGKERRVNYIAGTDTGFVAEGDHLPVPVVDTGATGVATSSATFNTATSSGSTQGSVGYTYQAPSTSDVFSSAPSRTTFPAQQFKSAPTSTGTKSHFEKVIGNVLLRQYDTQPGRTKFGYVFTEV